MRPMHPMHPMHLLHPLHPLHPHAPPAPPSPYSNLFFSTDIDTELAQADIIFVAVNTPTKVAGIGAKSAANVKNLELCARKIAEVATTSKIIVEKSTVPVQTARALKSVLGCNANPGVTFQVTFNV